MLTAQLFCRTAAEALNNLVHSLPRIRYRAAFNTFTYDS